MNLSRTLNLLLIITLASISLLLSCSILDSRSGMKPDNIISTSTMIPGSLESRIHSTSPSNPVVATRTPSITITPSSTSAPSVTSIINLTPSLTFTPTYKSTRMAPENLRQLIGQRFPPEIWKCQTERLDYIEKVGSSVYVLDSCFIDKRGYIFLTKELYHDIKGEPHFEILDILVVEISRDDQGIFVACDQTGKIIIIARFTEEARTRRWITNDLVEKAWQVDLTYETFVEIPIDNIECSAESIIN